MSKNNNKDYALYEVTKFNNFKEMLDIAVKEAGDTIAFKFKNPGDETVHERTYTQFRNETISLGTELAEMDLASLHVACIGENSYKWVVTYLTMINADGVFVPVDKELPIGDIINVLNESDSEVVFLANNFEKAFKENIDKLKKVKYFITFERTEDDGIFLSFDKLMAKGEKLYKSGNKKYTIMKNDPEKLKMLVYTSGTTGLAKGVMLTEHNLAAMVYHGLRVSTVYDTCLSVLPYHHTYESVCGLLVSLHHHSTICINDKIRAVLKNLQLYKPSYLYVVPAFAESFYKKINSAIEEKGKTEIIKKLIKVSNNLRKAGIDMRRTFFKSIHATFGGRLKKIVCGGAPIRPEIGEFFDDIGINLINGYGISECSPLVSANRDYFNDFNTAGVKLPCIDIKIDNYNDDGIGEICVKGETVMLGYYKNEAETKKVLIDGWFYTGDYGLINEYGQITITGRKKNLIVLNNGKNIYPEEIENYIMSIPYVNEVVVYAIKNDNGEESALCAEAYLNDEKLIELNIKKPIENLKQDITAACKQLPAYKQIQKIILRQQEFEKTTSKKIKRNTIIKHT